MLKRSSLQPKKPYSLKKTGLKANNKKLLKKGSLKKSNSLNKIGNELQKTELKKQNEQSKERWEKAREQALVRDNHKCVICGKPATQVHHIHLRSKRKDLLYALNNLVSLCDVHHFHKGSEKYLEQNMLIAHSKGITVEKLLEFAES